MEVAVTTAATSRAKLQSNHYHQQTNTQIAFLTACRTCDQRVTGSNHSLLAVECSSGQVVNTNVPPSPSSILWHQPMSGRWCLVAGKVATLRP